MENWREAYFKHQSIEDPVKRSQYRRKIDFSRHEPVENIYELAILLLDPNYHQDEWYFRGQRNSEWTIRPSMFRSDVIDNDEELQKLSSLVRYLQSKLHITQDYALAVAKHYSGVLESTRTRSWLLDITKSPLIACFFASLNGHDDETGKIYLFKSYEMDKYSSSTPKRMGEVNLISPDNIPRIRRQKGVFVDGAHPDLLEGYLPLNHSFEQKEGMLFEDPTRNITKDYLLSTEDRYAEIMLEWEEFIWPEEVPASKMVVPPHTPFDPLTPTDYLEIIKEWLSKMNADVDYKHLSEEERKCLQDLCHIHWKIKKSDEMSDLLKSELNLKQTLQAIVAYSLDLHENQGIIFDDVVSRYWNESGGAHVDRGKVQSVIREVRPDFEFNREWENRHYS